jgi:ATP phosphoribosyltransferase regulatory subunit HisZ
MPSSSPPFHTPLLPPPPPSGPNVPPGVEAEAELLAAVVSFMRRVGLSSEDVGLRLSSRRVLAAVLQRYGVPDDSFAQVCVVVDKLEKLPKEDVQQQLAALGVTPDAVDGADSRYMRVCVCATDMCNATPNRHAGRLGDEMGQALLSLNNYATVLFLCGIILYHVGWFLLLSVNG